MTLNNFLLTMFILFTVQLAGFSQLNELFMNQNKSTLAFFNPAYITDESNTIISVMYRDSWYKNNRSPNSLFANFQKELEWNRTAYSVGAIHSNEGGLSSTRLSFGYSYKPKQNLKTGDKFGMGISASYNLVSQNLDNFLFKDADDETIDLFAEGINRSSFVIGAGAMYRVNLNQFSSRASFIEIASSILLNERGLNSSINHYQDRGFSSYSNFLYQSYMGSLKFSSGILASIDQQSQIFLFHSSVMMNSLEVSVGYLTSNALTFSTNVIYGAKGNGSSRYRLHARINYDLNKYQPAPLLFELGFSYMKGFDKFAEWR